MGLNDELRDATVRHSVYLGRYSAGLVRELLDVLNQADADIVSQVLDAATPISQARLDSILANVREIQAGVYSSLGEALNGELADLASYEVNFQASLIDSELPIALSTTTPDASTLFAIVEAKPFRGKLLEDWLSEAEAAAAARVRDTIRLGVVEGQTITQMATAIRGTKALNYTDGILDISRRGVAAMVRTAVNHTVTTARQAYVEANDDIVKVVQWVSTLDGGTSAPCRARDGKVFPIDKGPRPPAHIACRSSITPVFKSWRELGIDIDEAPPGTRASLDGQVPAAETYQSWLKKQPAKFQDEILGNTKGKLFREGGLTLDRFVDKNGIEYNLKQLELREREAFAKIE